MVYGRFVAACVLYLVTDVRCQGVRVALDDIELSNQHVPLREHNAALERSTNILYITGWPLSRCTILRCYHAGCTFEFLDLAATCSCRAALESKIIHRHHMHVLLQVWTWLMWVSLVHNVLLRRRLELREA
jgi:hypothetical protein